MPAELSLAQMVDPAVIVPGIMLGMAVFIAGIAIGLPLASRLVPQAQDGSDQLADLFDRDTFQQHITEACPSPDETPVPNRRRRSVRDRLAKARYDWSQRNRRERLEQVAVVMQRGGYTGRDLDELVEIVEGDGFVILSQASAAHLPIIDTAPTDIADAEIEELLLLPAPLTKAA